MSGRQRRTMMWLGAALVMLAGVSVAAWGLAAPVRVQTRPEDAAAPGSKAALSSAEASRQATGRDSARLLAALQQLCAMNLRRPLYDPPPTPPPPRPEPSMTVRLVGTINEPGHSLAMFQKPNGAIELCGLGESIDDEGLAVTVTRIEGGKVTVRYADELHELVVGPKPKVGLR
jgi:hypothetical protein